MVSSVKRFSAKLAVAFALVLTALAGPRRAAAQDPCQQFFPPPPASCYAIAMTPQGSVTPVRGANTSGYTQVFTVTLTGELGDDLPPNAGGFVMTLPPG